MSTDINTRITGPFQEFPQVSEWDAICGQYKVGVFQERRVSRAER